MNEETNVRPEEEDRDRWLSDGDCSKCRRAKHCRKPCTMQKRRKQAILSLLIRNRTHMDEMRKAMEQ